MFSRVFDEGVGPVRDADLLVSEGVDDQVVHTFIAFGFDGGSPIGEGFLDVSYDLGLGFVDGAAGIFIDLLFFAIGGVGEVIGGAGGMQELLGERAFGGRGLEIVFVFWEVLGHGDEFAADIVPGVEDDFGWAVGGLDGFHLLLCTRRNGKA